MTKTLKKNIRRCITGSLGRYIAIMMIILLGVAFLTGLKSTRPIMIATASDYLEETSLYDLRLLSTIGFDEEDVQAVAETDGVSAAEGSVNADFIWLRDSEESVYRAHMLTRSINQPYLSAGHLPQSGNECAVDAERFTEDMIGQTITISDCGDDENLFAYEEYTITGLVYSPFYLNIERGTTSLGNGNLDGFILIPAEGFDSEYYTELYVKANGDFELYSDEYEDFIDSLTDSVEGAAALSVQTRFDDLVAEGKTEIENGERELAEEKADAEAELADAKQHLDDAAAEIADGEAELANAKKQLDDAKAELNSGAEQIQSGFKSWESALDYGWDQYYTGKAELDAAYSENKPQLEAARRQLQEQEDLYESSVTAVSTGKAELNDYYVQLEQGQAEYDAALAQYNENYAAYEQRLAEYRTALEAFNAVKDTLPEEDILAQETILESTRMTLEQTAAALAQGKAALDENSAKLDAQRTELDKSMAELEATETQLAQMRTLLDVGWNDYYDGISLFKNQYAALDTTYSALVQFQNGIDSYYEGLNSYYEGVETLEDGRRKYADGLAEYEDGLAQFNTEIADAEQEIADAKADLAELEDPELYVLDRTTNSGYVSFETDSMIVNNLSTIFPIFFFLIAALVCSTTMTRMVDDERTQIGTLRAMGYSRGSIFAKYMLYAGSAAAFGCLLGYFGGGFLFPFVIWIAYKMLYNMPGFVMLYDPVLFFISLLASLLCSAGTTYFACRLEMASTPANLIRPKSPPAGKRIFLERITPLWKRLKFLHKVSLRNIFRFKKRMIMMILGIAGCTALVLTAFGIYDSVTNIANYQFDDIQKYNLSVTFEDGITNETKDYLEEVYGTQMETHAAAYMGAVDITGHAATKSAYLIASDDASITEIIDLHRNGSTVPYPGDGEIIISEKLADLAGIKIGDTVTLSVSDTDKAFLTVAGLVENYVQNYIYMTGTTYNSVFDNTFEATTLLLRVAENTDEYSLSAVLSKENGVISVSVVSDTRRMIDNMMQSLNYVVALVMACAGALAFIVLINLGNINISERVREIATIKVLGFHKKETGAYVFRENILLSFMGILIGLPLGVVLHQFVMNQIRVDIVTFKYMIQPQSYLLTVAMVLLFTIVTDLIMRKKIVRIDMAESLKSIE